MELQFCINCTTFASEKDIIVKTKTITLSGSESGRYFSGHFAMLCATIFWGALSPIAKGILKEGLIDGLALSVLRIGGGALLFLLASLLPSALTGDKPVERKDLLTLLIASVIMISLNQGLFIIAIDYTTPIDTSVMCTMTPVFTLLLAAVFIGQKLTPLKIAGVFLGLAGALFIAFSETDTAIASNPLLGNTLCLLAQLCAAVYYVFFLKIINKYPPFTIMKWMFLFAALTYVPCMLPFIGNISWNDISATSIYSLAYVIIFPTFIAYLLIPFSQRILKPTVISMYAYLQPVVSAVISSVMGLAIFGWSRILGTVMIFTGVFLVSSAVRKASHQNS